MYTYITYIIIYRCVIPVYRGLYKSTKTPAALPHAFIANIILLWISTAGGYCATVASRWCGDKMNKTIFNVILYTVPTYIIHTVYERAREMCSFLRSSSGGIVHNNTTI